MNSAPQWQPARPSLRRLVLSKFESSRPSSARSSHVDSNDGFRKLSYAQVLEHKPDGKQITTASITAADGLIHASKPPSENGLKITPLPHEDTPPGPDVSLGEKVFIRVIQRTDRKAAKMSESLQEKTTWRHKPQLD